MAAVKIITAIHMAETQYYSEYGHYAASLRQLQLSDKDAAGYRFTLKQTQTGYALFANTGNHTYYSDQSMSIHQHSGPGPATAADPLLGEVVRK
jgi:hypothetical protein